MSGISPRGGLILFLSGALAGGLGVGALLLLAGIYPHLENRGNQRGTTVIYDNGATSGVPSPFDSPQRHRKQQQRQNPARIVQFEQAAGYILPGELQ